MFDELITQVPLFARMYSYFRNHIFFADSIHVLLGLGIGLLFAQLFWVGAVCIILSLLGHMYAYIKGR